jgi:hypothetical protein
VKDGEAEARKAAEEARQAVIKACADLREAEMFLDAFKSRERSAVGGAAARVASSADIANTHASNLRESAVGGAAAEYLAREGQQACGSRLPSLSEIIVDRHTTKFHAGHEGGEHFNSLPERIEFRADSVPSISITISVAQRDFKRVLLALQSLLDVVESGSKGGASGHGCHSSSSVRCGGCTASCGLAGVTHLTGEGAIRGADGSSSSASSSAYSGGAEGDRGLPGASAHTPAGHTVQVSKYKIFAHPEGGVRRG